jgi:hypothetical protein
VREVEYAGVKVRIGIGIEEEEDDKIQKTLNLAQT